MMQSIGSWRVLKPIGRGGQAQVFECRRAGFSKEWAAVKVLSVDWEHDQDSDKTAEAVKRWQHEVQVLNRIQHRNVVRIIDSGEDPLQGPYLAMELVQGVSLAQLHSGRASTVMERYDEPSSLLANVLLPVADALAFCHHHGVAHRDVKPENVMITQEKKRGDIGQYFVHSPVLVDFGIAITDGQERITTDGALFSVGYVPPEVLACAHWKKSDPIPVVLAMAIDVFQVGVLIAAHCGSGRPNGLYSLDVSTTWPEAPPAVVQLVLDCTHEDPLQRPDMNTVVTRLIEVVKDYGLPVPEGIPTVATDGGPVLSNAAEPSAIVAPSAAAAPAAIASSSATAAPSAPAAPSNTPAPLVSAAALPSTGRSDSRAPSPTPTPTASPIPAPTPKSFPQTRWVIGGLVAAVMVLGVAAALGVAFVGGAVIAQDPEVEALSVGGGAVLAAGPQSAESPENAPAIPSTEAPPGEPSSADILAEADEAPDGEADPPQHGRDTEDSQGRDAAAAPAGQRTSGAEENQSSGRKEGSQKPTKLDPVKEEKTTEYIVSTPPPQGPRFENASQAWSFVQQHADRAMTPAEVAALKPHLSTIAQTKPLSDLEKMRAIIGRKARSEGAGGVFIQFYSDICERLCADLVGRGVAPLVSNKDKGYHPITFEGVTAYRHDSIRNCDMKKSACLSSLEPE